MRVVAGEDDGLAVHDEHEGSSERDDREGLVTGVENESAHPLTSMNGARMACGLSLRPDAIAGGRFSAPDVAGTKKAPQSDCGARPRATLTGQGRANAVPYAEDGARIHGLDVASLAHGLSRLCPLMAPRPSG
ncbi:hypothetical protein GCM10009792_02900 [Microcella alkalica]